MHEASATSPAWKRWLTTTNHKDVGILYLVTSLIFFVTAGVMALFIRTQLAVPRGTSNSIVTQSQYTQLVTTHGLLMILWFLSPFAFAFANYFIPLQIGARDLAFPRLNSMSYWFYFFSGIAMGLSFLIGAPNTGWTLYAPLTDRGCGGTLCAALGGFDLGAIGLVLMVTSITMSSVNFIVTILKMRAPGMKLKFMPLFSWTVLITVFMMLYAFPSLLAGALILFADRNLGTQYFSLPQGGFLLWANIFWFFGHPEVYIVLFPAIGLVGDILPTFTRRPLYGAKYIVMSIAAAAVISFIVWGHHMFVTGVNPLVTKIFTVSTVAVSLPFDVMTIAMIESFVKAKIKLKTPALFAIGSIALFIIGGITGVFLASVALDHDLRGGYWVVAHFHYVMVGGSAMALIGGLYYWYPKVTGRMFNERIGKTHFALSFIGFNLLYFPMFFVSDMPRRIFTYDVTAWAPWNELATLGAFIFGGAQLLLFLNLRRSLKTGAVAGSNPWNGHTLEWSVPSPPPAYDFDQIPRITDDGTVHFSGPSSAHIPNGHSHTTMSHLSQWPLLIAAAAFVFLIGAVFTIIIALVGVALGVYALYGYGRERFVAEEEPGAESWPFNNVPKLKLGVWVFLGSEVIFFSVLLGAYLFVRTNVGTTWPQVDSVFNIDRGFLNTIILLTSSLTAVLGLSFANAGSKNGLLASLITTLALGAGFLINKGLEWRELFSSGFTFNPASTNLKVPATTYFITTGAHGIHVFAGLVMMVYLISMTLKGHYLKEDSTTIEHFGLYWHFVDIVWIFLFPLFYLL